MSRITRFKAALALLLFGLASAAWATDYGEALHRLDVLIEKAEGLTEAGSVAELRALTPALVDALEAVGKMQPPTDALNPIMAGMYQEQLLDLAGRLRKAKTLSDEELLRTVAAIHPLVGDLMGELGIPHHHHHHQEERK